MFITVSTLERMMISVWDRSRNVSLINHWNSSACYSHMAMLAWPIATFAGNILNRLPVVLCIHTWSLRLREIGITTFRVLSRRAQPSMLSKVSWSTTLSPSNLIVTSHIWFIDSYQEACNGSGKELGCLQDTPSFLESEPSGCKIWKCGVNICYCRRVCWQ